MSNTCRICILVLDVKESKNEDTGAAMTKIFNELFQEKLPDARLKSSDEKT